jgi:hypothetical protein
MVQKLKTTVSVKNELQGQLAAKYDAQSVFLSSQDVAYVEAGDDEKRFVGHVQDFLGEINRDQKNYAELTKGNTLLQDQLVAANKGLTDIQAATDWNNQDLRKYAEAEMAVSDISYDTMAKNAGVLGDISKEYVNKTDGTAAAYEQAWDRTKHNEKRKELFQSINTVLDLMTGVGIGGNALTQFVAKEFSEIGKTFDRLTNAYWLRNGQIGDLAQAAMNSGYSFKNFASNTTMGMTNEIKGNADMANSHLVTLSNRFRDWVTLYNKRDDKGGGWYIPSV